LQYLQETVCELTVLAYPISCAITYRTGHSLLHINLLVSNFMRHNVDRFKMSAFVYCAGHTLLNINLLVSNFMHHDVDRFKMSALVYSAGRYWSNINGTVSRDSE
jgi:hypothetical protein